jgi:tungstate transport system substrate-binding protein
MRRQLIAFIVGAQSYFGLRPRVGAIFPSGGAREIVRSKPCRFEQRETHMQPHRRLLMAALALVGSIRLAASAQQNTITVASTTSTEQSGLFGHLLPAFTSRTGINVRVVAVGTGQALDIGRRGDADVVFVHDQAAEERFVQEGFATRRQGVMYNDFVIVGPKSDPAKAAGKDVAEGLKRIAAARAPFISRSDKSGTHAAELRYWKDAGVDLSTAKGEWYREIGQGMGPALNTASAQNAYVLADRGTWLSFKKPGDLAIVSRATKNSSTSTASCW